MSLRAKLALLFGTMGLLASALVGVFAFRATEGELDETTDEFLATRAEEIAGGSRRPPGGNRPQDGRGDDNTATDLQLPFEEDALAQTITADGDVLPASIMLPVTANTEAMAELEPERVSTSNVRFDDVTIDGSSYRMVSMALPDGGAVQVARATGEDDDVLSALTLRIGLIAAAVAVAGAVAGWLIARQTTSSLRRLAGVASDVAETRDFTTEVDVESRDEIGQLATSFRSMLAALEESREQQLRLVHDAGHELRTPLTSLRANVALLDRFERLSPDDRREIVTAVESELVELSDLFTELIELATDQRSTDMHVETVDLATLATGVAERWERRSNREIVVTTTSSPVACDVAMVERAITNLLSNAHKFSPTGQPIEIVVTPGRLAVRDRGPGVPAADRARIFDRFYRSELTRSMPGSGLGLAIVSQIVELHDGTVFVDDAPGGGAEIGFTLPTR